MAFDAGSVVAKIKADVTDFQAGVKKVTEGAQTMAEKVKGGVGSMNDKIKEMTPQLRKGALVLGGIAATGTLMLNDWRGAAMGAEVEMARFSATLAAIGGVSEETKTKILAAADAAVQLGFDDEETANVLANFYQRTKDVNQAMTLNSTAMDLARKKNIGLSEAANLVTQVLSGNGRVLKQYGIDIKESASPLEALAQLQAVVGGQSEAFMETAIGKGDRLAIQIGNLKENLGTALIPIMNLWTDAIGRVVEWLNNLSPTMQKTIAYVLLGITAFAAIAAPILGFITLIPLLTTGLTAVGTALAFLFSPIGLLIVAIAALAVAWNMNLFGIQEKTKIFFQMIVDLVELFKMAWEGDWYYIQSIATTAFEFLTGFFTIWWETIKMLFQVAVALLRGDWQGAWTIIKQWALDVFLIVHTGAQKMWDALKSIFTMGAEYVSNAWSSMMNGIQSVMLSVWDRVKQVFTDGINWIIDKINAAIGMFDAAISKVTFGASKGSGARVPRMAEGGIVKARPGGIIANIGEGRHDEAVIPLDGKHGLGGGVHIHLHDSVISSVDAATELFDAAIRRVQPRLG